MAVYGGCLWVTAQRTDVHVFFFEWERRIPFVPFFVWPYLSIDLFFIGAPFLLRDRRELSVYVRRVVATILVAGAFFLLWPLRFAFPRPPAGAVFESFRALDAPFNLFPSLHAALLFLLAPVYARRLRGFVRALVLFWFFLIALSPILTRQHHVLDIAGGFLLAAGCTYFFTAGARP